MVPYARGGGYRMRGDKRRKNRERVCVRGIDRARKREGGREGERERERK